MNYTQTLKRRMVTLIAIVCIAVMFPITVRGTGYPVPLTHSEIFVRNTDAVFMIITDRGLVSGQGSGFFIHSNGIGVTAYHVLRNADSAFIQTTLGESFPILGYYVLDRENDLAIFQVDRRGRNFHYVNFAPAGRRTPRIGDTIYSISSPSGGHNFFERGSLLYIGDFRLSTPDSNFYFDLQNALIFESETAGGSSGGAVFNRYGEAIGVLVGGNQQNSTGSAVLIDRLVTGRTINYGQYSPLPRPNALGIRGTQNTPSGWARAYVERGIAEGIVPLRFQHSYNQPTTRAEFATLAVQVYEAVTGREITGRATFNDTNDVNAQKMGYLGVVTGVGHGNFAPRDILTREQAAVMLSRLVAALGSPLQNNEPTFADNSSISNWAFRYVGQVQGGGLMGETGGNRFSPSGHFMMEQSIATMMRLLEGISPEGIPVSISAVQVLPGVWDWDGGWYFFHTDGTGNRDWSDVTSTFRWNVANDVLILNLPDDTEERWRITNVATDNITIGGALFTRRTDTP